MLKRWIIRSLLGALNSKFLNGSPCQYGFIGNVDAFSRSNLECEELQRPGITVKVILEEADRFKTCPMSKDGGLTVLEPDGSSHDATVWDMHELNLAFASKPKDEKK